MNILIVANHYAVCSARYAADAFVRLGHTVRHVGPAMGRNIWGGQVPEEYVWTPDADYLDEISLLMDDNFGSWLPDLIIVMDSDPAILDWAKTVASYKGDEFMGTLIVWGVDNHVRDYRRPYFDHYFLAHKSVSVMPWTHNLDTVMLEGKLLWAANYPHLSPDRAAYTDMTWLPCAYDPIAFPPSQIAWDERQYDVCMVGVMYPKRWELVQAMRQAGLKVFAGTGLIYDAYRDAYQNSRVALVSSACGDLPIRLFEGAGMGCAVLCDPIGDLQEYLDIPATPYFSIPHAVEQAGWLQSQSNQRAQCATWAANHTWDARCNVIIDWMATR